MPPPHTKITYTLNGSKIRLEYEDWAHIISGHREMIDHSQQILLTVNSPQAVYRDPLYPKKFKAFRFDERMGTYVMVIYVDYGGNVTSASATSACNKSSAQRAFGNSAFDL